MNGVMEYWSIGVMERWIPWCWNSLLQISNTPSPQF